MKKLNDSTWERDPDMAYAAVIASINKDEANGYLFPKEADSLRRRARRLRDRNRGRK